MSYASELVAIEKRWSEQWLDGASERTATSYANVKFDVPAPNVSWARIHVLNATPAQLSIGAPNNNVHRHPGIIVVSIFTEAAKGTVPGRTLADFAAAIYRNAVFDGVHCREAAVVDVGLDGPRYQHNVRIPFFRDEHL